MLGTWRQSFREKNPCLSSKIFCLSLLIYEAKYKYNSPGTQERMGFLLSRLEPEARSRKLVLWRSPGLRVWDPVGD